MSKDILDVCLSDT